MRDVDDKVCKTHVISRRIVVQDFRNNAVALSRPMRETMGAAKTFAVIIIVDET